VEIVDRESNAVEGRHFRLLASTVTIPAGRLAVDVPVQGIYENIGATDSLGFALNLIVPEEGRGDRTVTREIVDGERADFLTHHLGTGSVKRKTDDANLRSNRKS